MRVSADHFCWFLMHSAKYELIRTEPSPTRQKNGVIVFKRFKSKTRSMLGIDISSTSVRILEISTQNEKPCIEAFGCKPLIPSTVEAEGIIHTDVLTSTIKTLLSEIKPASRQVAIAVPDSMVISKIIQLVNNLNDLELEELAIHEAKKLLTFSSEELSVDFVVLGASEVFGMLDVLLVVSKSENIDKRVKALKSSGLEVIIVDIESHAIARAVNHINESNSEAVIAVIDIRPWSMRLCIITGGKVVYARDEIFDADQLLIPVLKPICDLALMHLKRNFQFFFANCHYREIDLIYVAGEGVNLNELAQFIGEGFGASTVVANPINCIEIVSHQQRERFSQLAPSFLVAFGLALRGYHAN
ncbi:hypothetical protein B6N58_09615 [Legionella micdadei]|nr:hypothetical protein B6N58_09615 [Legionella micdadei]ARG99786.1 hypothetical protein B6V88_04795 [Legionella micdadei]